MSEHSMSEANLHPFETILRFCAAAAPEPWYPRLFAQQEGVDREALGRCLEMLWLGGLIARTDGGPEKGPAISLTCAGQRVLLDPAALKRLCAGEPRSAHDRGAIIRQALQGRSRPFVTVALILINVLVFGWGYLQARANHLENDFMRGTAVMRQPPTQEEVKRQEAVYRIQEASGSLSAYNLIDGQGWRVLTAGFVHIGFLHLLMNMVVLYLAGRFIEQIWGHVRYLVIYLAAVLGGDCLAVAHNVAGIAGASGGVCGLIAAEAVWFFFNRSYLPRALFRQARTIFLVNLVLLIFISSFENVSGWGHFGGAAAGALTAMLLQLQRFGPPTWRWLALTGFASLLWYGPYAIKHARLTDPAWQQVEANHLLSRLRPQVQRATKKASALYEDKVAPLLEKHPTRRDPAQVETALPILREQQHELNAVVDTLDHTSPYVNPDAEEARQIGRAYVRAMADWFAEAEHILQIGAKRSDQDRQALRQQVEKVQDMRRKWAGLFERVVPE